MALYGFPGHTSQRSEPGASASNRSPRRTGAQLHDNVRLHTGEIDESAGPHQASSGADRCAPARRVFGRNAPGTAALAFQRSARAISPQRRRHRVGQGLGQRLHIMGFIMEVARFVIVRQIPAPIEEAPPGPFLHDCA